MINKSEYRLYKLANCNKLPLLEKNIKVVIAALGEQEKLVVGVDRREDFTTEEVFDRLVLEERVKEVFPEATTEFQRNINNKYMRVDWVEGALANGIVNAPNFIAIVRERVFCLQLVKHLLENFRRMSFYFPLALAHELTISKEATEGNRLTILQP